MGLRGEELAYATLDYIREHPEEWDQDYYICETSACFAGRACLLAGLSPQFRGNYHPGEKAKELLGWGYAQENAVFYCYTRNFDILELQVKKVLSGEIT